MLGTLSFQTNWWPGTILPSYFKSIREQKIGEVKVTANRPQHQDSNVGVLSHQAVHPTDDHRSSYAELSFCINVMTMWLAQSCHSPFSMYDTMHLCIG